VFGWYVGMNGETPPKTNMGDNITHEGHVRFEPSTAYHRLWSNSQKFG
jgi:hypothetical protein